MPLTIEKSTSVEEDSKQAQIQSKLEKIDLSIFEEDPRQTQLTATMSEAVKIDPVEHAKITNLSKQSGVPGFAVQSNPEQIQQKLKLDQINLDGMVKRSPKTSKFLTDNPDNSIIAQEDVATNLLQGIEKTFDNIGKTIDLGFDIKGKGVLLSNVDDTPHHVQDLIPSSAMPIGMESMARQLSIELADDMGIATDDDLTKAKEEASNRLIGEIQNLQEKRQSLTPSDMNIIQESVRAGIESLATNAPGFALTVLTGGRAAPLLISMGSQTYFDSYASGRAGGLTPDESRLFASIDSFVEVGTELFPIKILEKILTGKSTGLKKDVLKFLIREQISEQPATLLQSINAAMFGLDEQLNNAQSIEEMIAIQLRRQAVTALSTIVSSGVQATAATAVNRTINKITSADKKRETKQDIEQRNIDKLNNDSVKSELRKNDVESFKQFVRDSDGDNNTNVFIDGIQTSLYLKNKTNDEIQNDPALKILSNAVNENQDTGVDVTVPIDEFMGVMAGTDHFNQLREFMTLSDGTISPFRQEQHKSETKAYIDTLLDQIDTNTSEYVEAQEIYTSVRDQLIDTGRLSSAEASIVADIVPAWATAQARRTGKTIKQVYEGAGLTIEGPQTGELARLQGEQVLSQEDNPNNIQRTDSNDFVSSINSARDANPNGLSVAVYDASEYDAMDKYTLDNGNIGFAIENDGNLVGVFKNPKSSVNKAIDIIVPEAIKRGATKLDAFDGFLTKAYARHGFVEKYRAKWDDKYAPPGWDKIKQGTPDVVYMELENDNENLHGQTNEKSVQDKSILRQSSIGVGRKRSDKIGEGASLEGAPIIEGATGPDLNIVSVAKQYAKDKGIDFSRQSEYVTINPDRATRIADAYDNMKHDPQNPKVKEAFDNLIKQTTDQYNALIDAGYSFYFFDESNDPYQGNPWNAMRDIRSNKTMGVFATEAGFGSNDTELNVDDNPLLADTGITWEFNGKDKRVLANDLFRAVHDAFGHGLEGAGFRAEGEENAWQAHIKLFTGSAIGAITTETRGQNSWLNYGPHGENNRTAKVEDTIFADQKTGLMPEWTWKEGVVSSTNDELLNQSSIENLATVHNLSSENILAAADLGGLAAPSLATIRTDLSKFDGFGEVSLIADPSLLESSKARTFDADIYSPRQPRAIFDIDTDKVSQIYRRLDPDNLGLDKPDIGTLSESDGASSLQRSIAFQYEWLQSQGKAPKLKNKKAIPLIKKFSKTDKHRFDLEKDEKFIKAVSDHYQDKLDKLVSDGFKNRADRMRSLFFEEDGSIKFSKLRDMSSEISDFRNTNGKDIPRLREEISKKLRVKKLREDYDVHVNETFNELVKGKKLFKGFTPAGNRRHVPYNLQNVVKDMTQQLQAGENFFYGAGTIRSKFANEMKTIQQVQAKRDEIVSEEDMGKIKNESNDIFMQVLDDLRKFYKFDSGSFGYADDVGSAIIQGRKGLNETFNMTPEAQKIIDDFTEYLVALPSSYFETKIQRAVQFNEFDTAVVPRGMRKDALKVLKDAGLKIKSYNPNDNNSRAEVIAKQQKLLFQNNSENEVRGYYDPENSIIRLTESSDLSTFLHEFAHFMYEMEATGNTELNKSINSWYKRNAEEVAKEANSYLGEKFDVLKQGVTPVDLKDEGDVDKVATGIPVTFHFIHNTESATSIFGKPIKGDTFGRDFEPAARFVNVTSKNRADEVNNEVGGDFISGKLTFNNPLVIPSHGVKWKENLSKQYNGKTGKKLSLALIADGHDGVITTNENHISETIDLTTFDESKALFQKGAPEEKPGSINENDVTTYLDAGTTGSTDKDKAIRRAVHEQFARGFETYLMEGKAPSIELRNAFRVFARWLAQIYRSVRNKLNIKLDDDMRQVFDRLLATEDQINDAESRVRVEPLFTDAAMAGMTDEEFSDYQKRQEKVKDVQVETLRDKLIKTFTRKNKQWWKEEKADLVDEEISLLAGERVYITAARLRDGDIKLDHATVKEMIGEERTDKRGFTSIRISAKLRGMTAKGKKGVHPDEAAGFFGYKSGAEMLNDLINAPPIKEMAESNAEKRMIERHGDIFNDGTIEKFADEAVQNEERGKLILHELKILSRGTNQRAIDLQTIKSIAEDKIGKLSFREIQPGKYRKAEINAAHEAGKMLGEGNKEGAANAKTRQALNYYLGMAATEAKNNTIKIVDHTARYNKKKVREEIQKAEGGYWEQIEKILDRFEFRKSATLKSVDQTNENITQDINTWMNDRIEKDGDGLLLHNAVLNEFYITHWKNVAYSDLQGISDSVKNIEYVARYANKITRLGEEITFNNLVERWVSSMNEKVKTKFKPQRTDIVEGRNFGRMAMAQMTKIPFLTSWLDGGERVGLSHQILMQPFNDAYATEIRLWKKAGKPILDAITDRNKEDEKRHLRKVFIPEIVTEVNDGNLYGSQVLAVALNTGNEGNLRKLLLGEGWANPDNESEISFQNPKLQAVLSYMTESDWKLIQKTWDQMDTLYPQLAEVHRRTTGVVPPKVKAVPVDTPYGTFKGGYYPVKYDSNRSQRAAENEDKLNAQTESMFSNTTSIQASVNASATNERTGFYDPIRLSLDVVPAHFQETIHYITHHDAVREANRLIRDKRVAKTIKEKLGPEEYAQLKPWLNDIAKDGREAPTKLFWDNMFRQLRFGVTVGIMGFKASTGIIQISGLSNTIAEVGMANTMQSMRSVLGSPAHIKEAWEFALEHSKVLEHRADTMDREIKNEMQMLENKRGVLAASQEASLKHIALIQTYMVDLPSWNAAYIKSMKEYGDEERAYQYADWVIENVQGSGATKDMAQIMRSQKETDRMLTMFMTFFSSLWNAERDLVKGANSGLYSKSNIAAKLMFLFTIPVLLEMMIRGEFSHDDDDDDTILQTMLTKVAMYPLQSVPVIRDIANASTGDFGYNISPLQSIIETGTRTIPKIIENGFTDEEITKSQIKGATKFIGAAVGVPGTSQAWATGEHLYDVTVDGEELTLHQLLFGPDRN